LRVFVVKALTGKPVDPPIEGRTLRCRVPASRTYIAVIARSAKWDSTEAF
jgi:hypothetical protein